MHTTEVNRIIYFFAANILTVSIGSTFGYATVNFPDFQKEDINLPSGPLTLGEASFFMSVITIGGIFGEFLFVYLLSKIGSRNAILFLGIPQMVRAVSFFDFISSFISCFQIVWLLIIFAQNQYYLILARFISGITMSGQLLSASLFITEIADNK